MTKQLDDLSIEEKVQIARAIIALEGAGESLDEIESFYNVDKSTISKIKKAVNDRLHEIFEPKQAITPEKPKAKSILERISKSKVSASSNGSTESVNLSEEQRSKLDKAFEVIKAYNDLPDDVREIKRKYTITADNLNAIAGFNRSIAGAWMKEEETKVTKVNEGVEQYRKNYKPQGKKGKDKTEPLKDFYTKQGKGLAAVGGSGSKK
jgi:hypothetical protein